MKILIAVPSYNRPYDADKRIGYWFKDLNDFTAKLFVCPTQYRYYQQIFRHKVVAGQTQGTPDGFVKQMIFIDQYAKKFGYDYVFKVDDDMAFRKSKRGKQYVMQDFTQSLVNLTDFLQDNNDVVGGCYTSPLTYRWLKSHEITDRNKPFVGNYFYKVGMLEYNKNIMCYLDYYAATYLRDKGRLITINDLYEDKLFLTNNGGIQSFDRLSMQKKSSKAFMKQFPHTTTKQHPKLPDFLDIDVSYYFKS